MRTTILAFLLLLAGCYSSEPVVHHTEQSLLPVWNPAYKTAFVDHYTSGPAEEENLDDVQCPIPRDCRIFNDNNRKCVWCSLECLGRWADCAALVDLTHRPECQQGANPSDASRVLKSLGVKYELVYSSKAEAIELIKKAMSVGRGALFTIPGHAMVVCHYDEQTGIVKIIDNCDRNLRVQTWSIQKFHQKMDAWAMAVIAEPDPFPAKAQKISLANQIPIIDWNNPQGTYDKNYIPAPKKL